MEADPAIRVLFIGGMGRSGSTILDRLLGSAEGVCSVGELRKIWRRGLLANELCGCGEPFRACPFWTPVVARAFGELGQGEVEAIVAEENALLIPMRNEPFFRFPGRMPAGLRALHARVVGRRTALFRAIAAVSGARLVVDSSKDPTYGAALRTASGLDVRAVHLVRDSRAVACSWAKVKDVRRVAGRVDQMPRLSPARSSFEWMVKNAQVEADWAFTGRGMRVRYEAFARDPERVLRKVLRFAGYEGPTPHPEAGRWRLGLDHTVLGNPMRFDQGPVAVRLDDAWKTELPARDRWLVTALTLPGLLRHGYSRALLSQ
jgi:hypothetical protein